MSCTDESPEYTAVEREVELPAAPSDVWDALPGVLGDEVELTAEPGGRVHTSGPDGERVGVVEEADAPHRLAFWWTPVEGDEAPSIVELELIPIGAGTRLRVRETRFDADRALSAFMSAGLARGPRTARRAPDRVFAALGDPTRRRIVERLGRAPATAGEIAAKLPVSRQAVVKHLGVLEDAGLAEGSRSGRSVIYRLTPGPFAEAAQWMGDVGAAWDRRLATLAKRVTPRG